MPEKKKLFLLDAMALIYRAYFALNKLQRDEHLCGTWICQYALGSDQK